MLRPKATRSPCHESSKNLTARRRIALPKSDKRSRHAKSDCAANSDADQLRRACGCCQASSGTTYDRRDRADGWRWRWLGATWRSGLAAVAVDISTAAGRWLD